MSSCTFDVRAASGDSSWTLTTPMPPELEFLTTPSCNPDLTDSAMRSIGNMRDPARQSRSNAHVEFFKSSEVLHHIFTFNDLSRAGAVGAASWKHQKVRRLRSITRRIIKCWLVQIILAWVLIFDGVLTVISLFFANEDWVVPHIFQINNWLVVFIFGTEVLARFFCQGWHFLRSCLNIMELAVVPMTAVDAFIFPHLHIPTSWLRLFRPLFNLLRVLRFFLRAAGKAVNFLDTLRESVSKNRVRFKKDGFNLDLAYIAPQIIAASQPAVGFEKIFFNPVEEFSRFLNERHGNKYLVLNAMEERHFPLEPFFFRNLHFPIEKDGVPTLEGLYDLCVVLTAFLKSHRDHVLVVLSRYAQGRCILIIAALLLHSGEAKTTAEAISFIEKHRIQEDALDAATSHSPSLDSASQRRFLEYFAFFRTKSDTTSKIRSARLRRIEVHGLHDKHRLGLEVCGFAHEGGSFRRDSSKDKKHRHELASTALRFEKMVTMGTRELEGHATKIISKAELDSAESGCVGEEREPIFTSAISSQETAKVLSIHKSDKRFPMSSWDFADADLQGEVRFEFHVNNRHSVMSIDEGEEPPSKWHRLRFFKKMCARVLCCHSGKHGKGQHVLNADGADMRRDSYKMTKNKQLLFSFWLHTTFLELDEPTFHKYANAYQADNQDLTVVLQRFDLDKAAGGPRLRTFSPVMRVQLEFQVEHRLRRLDSFQTPSPLSKPGRGGDPFASGPEVSEKCSLNWLTWGAARLWPFAENGLMKLFKDKVEPALNKGLPAPFNNIVFSNVDLGDGRPQFGPVVAFARQHDGYELQLDVMVCYCSQTNIVMDIGFARLGIGELSVTGTLSVKLKPIIGEFPIVAGVQLFFINPPLVDLKFSGSLEVANIPMIHRGIIDAINKAVLGSIVLPNIFSVDYSPSKLEAGAELCSLRDVLPVSVLRLCIVEARTLAATDLLITFERSADPYVVARLGQQTTQTATISRCLNPRWDHYVNFLVHSERQYVSIQIYDEDFLSSDFLGRVESLSISEIIHAGDGGFWAELTDTPDGQTGTILVKGSLLDLKDHNPSQDSAFLQQTFQHVQPGSIPEEPAGVVIVELFGAHVPPEVSEPKDLSLKACIGGCSETRRCAQEVHASKKSMNEQIERTIERLSSSGWEAEQIADVIGEDVHIVHEVSRRRLGWNVMLSHRINLLVTPADVKEGSGVMEISLLRKGSSIGSINLVLADIASAENCRLRKTSQCSPDQAIKLDLECRILYVSGAKRTRL